VPVYVYIYLILTGRAAAGLQNGQSYVCNIWKIGYLPVFIGWGSFHFRVFTYQGWKVLLYIDIHV
jgi:hypothetical protein